MKHFKTCKYFCIFFLFWFLNACFSTINLDHRDLDTAILNEYYEYNFNVEHGWSDWFDETDYMAATGGNLPNGVGLDSRGILFGTPTEVGNFRFEATVYDVDRSGFFGDGEVDSGDAEDFTFFVTEASTNPDCPHPADHFIQEFYLCLGQVALDNPAAGDTVVLDVNYYVYMPKGNNYDADVVDFEIRYNTDFFEVNQNQMNSTTLREAATRSDASVEFDASTPGVVHVHAVGQKKGFWRGGRFMDIPFVVKEGIVSGDYGFELIVNSIVSTSSDEDFPTLYPLDGNVSVTVDPPVEAPPAEEI